MSPANLSPSNLSPSDVLQIPVPCPFFEGRSSVYLIRSEPVTLIDSGIASDKAFAALAAGIAAHGLRVADIQRVVLTHKHIDHIGNAWRVHRESNAEIFIHEAELAAVTDTDASGSRFRQLLHERLRAWQVPETDPSRERPLPMPAWKLESAPASPLREGQRLEMADGELEVIHTPGHTGGSVCLKFGATLFSGDHVLPDISPNVGGGDMRQRGLLQSFLDSLQRVHALGDDCTVMPGHGNPFNHLTARIDQLRQHHALRLAKTLKILDNGPRTVYEVAQQLFGDLDGFHVMLGCAEANSHLEYLEDEGQVQQQASKFHLAS